MSIRDSLLGRIRSSAASPFPASRAFFSSASALLIVAPASAVAQIEFEDATRGLGVVGQGPSAGAAWGDLDADGWPDLWVTGHHGNPPTVYSNRRGEAFSDVTSTALPGWSPADLHGAAWADFDGDGDQDLVGLSGGGAGKGRSPNQLFVNQDGVLDEQAERWGLDYPLGRGRTPLWFDADGDGRLDVLFANYPRPGGKAPSALFRQTDTGFAESNEEFQFASGRKSRLDQWIDLASNAAAGRWSWPGRIAAGDFAQLADLDGDARLDLIAYSSWMRLYSTASVPFEEITTRFGWPSLDSVRDAAVEDLDGDGQLDICLIRAASSASTVHQINANELNVSLLKGPAADAPRGLEFRSDDRVAFEIYPPWRDPTDPRGPPAVFVGSKRRAVGELAFVLAPEEATSRAGAAPPKLTASPGLAIAHDPGSGLWSIRSTLPRVTFVIRSARAIRDLRTIGFESSSGALSDFVLMRRADAFESETLGDAEACHSVAAGDFDNDMDIDLYVVCSGPLRNRPNRLYENDGAGKLREVPNAGGAAGSDLGRGDIVAMADYDRDGFLDLFIANGQGPPPFADGPHQLFRNLGNGNHWIEIDLEGSRSNRDGIGASVAVEAGGRMQRRGQGGGMHSFAQNHARIHFGLGTERTVDRLTVRWPSGAVQTLEAVEADQILVLREPGVTAEASRP